MTSFQRHWFWSSGWVDI